MAAPTSFHVPTIDIGAYLSDPFSHASMTIIDDVHKACEHIGSFQIIGHNRSRCLQDAAFAGAAAFFSIPIEENRKLDCNKFIGATAGGFEVMGT
jgi:isopenicillin N synthase-like dioxygenase